LVQKYESGGILVHQTGVYNNINRSYYISYVSNLFQGWKNQASLAMHEKMVDCEAATTILVASYES
jgi:hypothetical protein